MIRSIEYVFYHHPNAQVMVHCKFPTLIDKNYLNIFVETGYDLVTTSYDMEEMLRDFGEKGNIVSRKDVDAFLTRLPKLRKGEFWYSHESDILRFLIIYTHGGIYLDIDVYMLRPLEKTFVNNIGRENKEGRVNGSFLNLERHHPLPGMALRWIILQYSVKDIKKWAVIGPELITKLTKNETAFSQSLTILPEAAIQPIPWDRVVGECFQGKKSIDLTNTIAIHLNNLMTKDIHTTEAGTPCDELLHRYCIFCHEIHTTGSFIESSVVAFPEIIKESRDFLK